MIIKGLVFKGKLIFNMGGGIVMKKGFTLLELIIVIIILGVLATLGFQQYQKAVEKSRGAEARQVLGQIRTEAIAHRTEYGSLDASTGGPAFSPAEAGIGGAADQIPSGCVGTHYFFYGVAVGGPAAVTGTATRCTGGAGKVPSATVAHTLTLTSDLAGGLETWGGDGAY